MRVESAKQIEMIVQSVMHDHSLTMVRLSDIRADGLGWLVTVVRGETTPSSFPVRPGTPVWVRMAIKRGLGVDNA
jgi:hypothetical protein